MLVAVLRLLAVVVVVVVVVELVPLGVDDDDEEDSAAVEGHGGRRMNSNGAVIAVYQRLPHVVSEICFGAQQSKHSASLRRETPDKDPEEPYPNRRSRMEG